MVRLISKFNILIIDIFVYSILLFYTTIYNKKLFIISIPYGRWGNRIMLFSYIISWAKKHNCQIINPSFAEYSEYFRYFKNNKLCFFPYEENIFLTILTLFSTHFERAVKRLTLRKFKLPYCHIVDLENKYKNTSSLNIKYLINNNNIILFHGFLFGERDFSLIDSNRELLNYVFSFTKKINDKCYELKNSVSSDKIIGICMRQGDYKTFLEGKFYLNDSKYLEIIKNLTLIFPDYGIFIACEEMKENFKPDNCIVSYKNPALNLCMLSKCDLLIGPPSTFLTWAAFYNNIEVCYIDNTNWNRECYSFNVTSF